MFHVELLDLLSNATLLDTYSWDMKVDAFMYTCFILHVRESEILMHQHVQIYKKFRWTAFLDLDFWQQSFPEVKLTSTYPALACYFNRSFHLVRSH